MWLLAVMTTCSVVLTSIPVVYGYLTAPADRWFSGVVYNMHDTAQYYSWMRESGHALLIENRLTSEPGKPIYFNLHWWLLGRFAAVVGLSLPQVYQLFRLSSIPLTMVALYLCCALVFPDRSRRRFAFLLSTLTSGLGWVWVLEKHLRYLEHLAFPRDVYTLAGNSLWVMTAAPHLAFALAVTLFTLLSALQGYRRKQGIWTAGAGILALFLGMGHIYDLVTVWTVVGVFGLLVTLRDGWSWDTFCRLGAVVLISAPSAFYWGWVSSDANPMWKQALKQYDNLHVFTPDPAHLLVLLGLPFIVALATFDGFVPLRRQSDERLFIKGWFASTLLLIYLPFRFRIMLLTGYQLPMTVLATHGLFDRILPWLQERLARERWKKVLRGEHLSRWAPVLFLLAVLPTNLYLVAWRVMDLGRHSYPFYLYQGDVEAMRWLEENTDPDDVVLSSFIIGHYIPGLAGNRPFLANSVMTMDSHRKEKMVRAFFAATTSDVERQDLLRQYNIRYLFYGPAERVLGGFNPAECGLFRQVYSNTHTQVFEVR